MEDKQQKNLKKGYTTGTCAAAACKAAALAFFTKKRVRDVCIVLPAGPTVTLPVYRCAMEKERTRASVIKYAGNDPDATDGAEIACEFGIFTILPHCNMIKGYTKAFQFTAESSLFTVYGGKGVGIVTKPGLAIAVGEPAINPVPRRMIEEAVREVMQDVNVKTSAFSLIISAPDGEEIAKKTMNARLGIIGGISILGTTGIVEPLSLSAYRHSILCAIDVAMAARCGEIVFSTGRSSEKAVQGELRLPEEAFILVADHMGYALREAKKKMKGARCRKITIAGQFGKFSKLAAGHFETHYTKSSIEFEFLAGIAEKRGGGKDIIKRVKSANTAREVLSILQENGLEEVVKTACLRVRDNARMLLGRDIDVGCMLIGYENEVLARI